MEPNNKGLIIFDLDGTLTIPTLDFDGMREEMGIPGGPILEAMENMEEPQRTRAHEILFRHEHKAAHGSELHARAAETIAELRSRDWPVAILTRNRRKWTKVVLEKHGIEVDAICTRDDGVVKPSPDPIYKLCEKLNRKPEASWMVGDHLFDLQCGNTAGCTTVLMVGDGELPEYADLADHVICSLWSLVDLVGN